MGLGSEKNARMSFTKARTTAGGGSFGLQGMDTILENAGLDYDTGSKLTDPSLALPTRRLSLNSGKGRKLPFVTQSCLLPRPITPWAGLFALSLTHHRERLCFVIVQAIAAAG